MRLHAVATFCAGLALCALAACERHLDSAPTVTTPRVTASPAPNMASVATPESGLQIRRGFVSQANALRFDSCSGVGWPMQGEGVREILLPRFGEQSSKRLYVELRGDLVDRKNDGELPNPELIVQELLYVTTNDSPERCDSSIHDYQVLIRSAAPGWSIKVAARTLIYTPAQGNAQRFSLAESDDAEVAVMYHGTLDAHKLEITLTQEPCIDPDTSDYFGFSARVLIDQQALQGCALPGE